MSRSVFYPTTSGESKHKGGRTLLCGLVSSSSPGGSVEDRARVEGAARLDARRIEHDAGLLAERGRRQGGAEAGADGAVGAVRAHNPAPDHADVALDTAHALAHGLGLVHVRDALANVELGVLLVSDAMDLEQVDLGVLVVVVPPVPEHQGAHMHARLGVRRRLARSLLDLLLDHLVLWLDDPH